MLNPVLIKKKAREMDISFENLLMGCILEEFVIFISENHHDELWVINDKIFGLDSYRRGMKDTLILALCNEEEPDIFVRKFSLSVVSHFMNIGVDVSTTFTSENTIIFELDIENMKVPVTIVIQEVRDINAFTKEKELKLSFQGEKSVSYREYPLEEKVAQLCFDILDKLELLNEMEEYIDLYDILVTEAVEGRKVKDCLAKRCEGKNGYDMNRFDKLRSYSEYSFMKKKWKRAVRKTNRKELVWEDVHSLIISFLEPIYKAFVDNEVFFGDWMPNITRFLD